MTASAGCVFQKYKNKIRQVSEKNHNGWLSSKHLKKEEFLSIFNEQFKAQSETLRLQFEILKQADNEKK